MKEPNLDIAHLGHLEMLTPRFEESRSFFVNVMKERKVYKTFELRQTLFGEIQNALQEAVRTYEFDNLNSNLATLGAQSRALDVQKSFLGKLSDSIEAGIGNLVDADLAKESARLQSLQVKQQLGAQALSIANSAPSIVLSFFR